MIARRKGLSLESFFYCIGLFLLSRVFFWGEALSLHHWMHSSLHPHALFSLLDSVWYAGIATSGYTLPKVGAHSPQVFFPLLPLLIKAIMLLTHLPVFIAGQILSGICFFCALCLFYHLLERDFNTQTARLGILLLVFSPYNIYFIATYTESLFLLLTLIFWLAGKNQCWLLMGIAGCFMSATHPNGILISFFGLWFMIEDYQKKQTILWRYWPILLVPMGVIAYMTFLYVTIKQPLAFAHEEIYWHRQGWHYGSIESTLLYELPAQVYNFCVYLLGLGLSLFLWRERFYKEALFIPILISIAILSGSFIALARYTASTFAFYFGLTLFAQKHQARNWILFTQIAFSIPLMYWWLSKIPMAY